LESHIQGLAAALLPTTPRWRTLLTDC
jgi:hypothetical protein